MGSKKFTLNWADIAKIGKNAILVGSAAALTYLSQNMEDINMGAMAALFVPIVAAGLDTAIKWLKDNKEE